MFLVLHDIIIYIIHVHVHSMCYCLIPRPFQLFNASMQIANIRNLVWSGQGYCILYYMPMKLHNM